VKVITDVDPSGKVLEKDDLAIQLQLSKPLPPFCKYIVDPVLRPKLVKAGWNDQKIAEFAATEKTMVRCEIDPETAETRNIESCDYVSGTFQAGVQIKIIRKKPGTN
jgi:hypothetical protein